MKTRVKKAFSEKQIARRISKLGAQIRKDAGKAEVFLLGVLKGASFFLADLMRAIPGEVSYGFIDVIREMADTEVATAMEIDYLQWSDIRGKHVYLLKDVVSTVVIETYLRPIIAASSSVMVSSFTGSTPTCRTLGACSGWAYPPPATRDSPPA